MKTETDKHSEDIVTEEFQKGYYIKSKVLRPAMVKVAVSIKEKKDSKKK
jgi:molecular chaperone GrpE